MSLPPVLPPSPPRLVASPAETPPPRALSRRLLVAVVLTGLAQLTLCLIRPSPMAGEGRIAYQIGYVVGTIAVWPLIVIGLFSLARRFRTPRHRALILLVVWSLFSLGHLNALSNRSRIEFQRADRHADPPAFAGEPFAEAASSATAIDVGTGASNTSTPPPAQLAAEIDDDFSAGSDRRLIEWIEGAQEDRYHAAVAAYARACRDRPEDPTLALERVNFIERFAYAEDTVIASAQADLQAAVDDLKRRFPTAPETVLYLMRNIFDPEFEAHANRYAHLIEKWPAPDRARFLLLRANAANTKGNATSAKFYARRSFSAQPTVEAALLLAQQANVEQKTAEVLEYLRHPVLERAEPWQKKQKLDLLFDLDEPAALELFDELAASAPFLLNNWETAQRLARAGRVDAARRIVRELPVNDWNRDEHLRQQFEFELAFGDAAHAHDAYRALRATGVHADPVLRDRYELFRRYPGLPWNAQDFVGASLLVLLFAGVAFSPALLLVPIHYRSLLRERRGQPRPGPRFGWGLRQAGMALGVMFVAEMAAIWLLQPEWMRTWWSEEIVEHGATDRALLLQQSFVWLALACILALLLWGADNWRLLGRGRWGFGKAIGIGLAATMGLRMVLLSYSIVWPEAVFEPIAAADSQTRQLCVALIDVVGPVGLLAAIAVLVPVLEELLFRGVLLQAMSKHLRFGWANTLQAVAFAAVHENLKLFPFYVAFGLLCGLLARRSGGLLSAIIVHACNNLLAALVIVAQHYLLRGM